MQRLTAIATIFLPLTFITGTYEINFSYMPVTQWHYDFYAILALCTSLAVAMLVYLWRKKMIPGRFPCPVVHRTSRLQCAWQ